VKVFKGFMSAARKKQWCLDNFINFRAMKQVRDIHKQLVQYLDQIEIRMVSCCDSTDLVRKAIVSAFFTQAAIRLEDGLYKTLLGNKIVAIHPSSVLFARKPTCVIYNQLVYTKKKYIRGILLIQMNWLSEIVPQFWKRTKIS